MHFMKDICLDFFSINFNMEFAVFAYCKECKEYKVYMILGPVSWDIIYIP